MKVALKCSNVLLERTLRLFLGSDISSVKESDFIITDEEFAHVKARFKIAEDGHLSLPFSKQQLDAALEEFLSTISQDANEVKSLEQRLDEILERFKSDILKLVADAKH